MKTTGDEYFLQVSIVGPDPDNDDITDQRYMFDTSRIISGSKFHRQLKKLLEDIEEAIQDDLDCAHVLTEEGKCCDCGRDVRKYLMEKMRLDLEDGLIQ